MRPSAWVYTAMCSFEPNPFSWKLAHWLLLSRGKLTQILFFLHLFGRPCCRIDNRVMSQKSNTPGRSLSTPTIQLSTKNPNLKTDKYPKLWLLWLTIIVHAKSVISQSTGRQIKCFTIFYANVFLINFSEWQEAILTLSSETCDHQHLWSITAVYKMHINVTNT